MMHYDASKPISFSLARFNIVAFNRRLDEAADKYINEIADSAFQAGVNRGLFEALREIHDLQKKIKELESSK